MFTGYWKGICDWRAVVSYFEFDTRGEDGIRDAGLLESALARPINRWNYGADDLTDLAAAYAYGIARNHPFVDGNKRTAWVAARLFFAMNQIELMFNKREDRKSTRLNSSH